MQYLVVTYSEKKSEAVHLKLTQYRKSFISYSSVNKKHIKYNKRIVSTFFLSVPLSVTLISLQDFYTCQMGQYVRTL